jgi:hypothetical protein
MKRGNQASALLLIIQKAQIAAVEELQRTKTGRQERMEGKVENVRIATSSQKSDSLFPDKQTSSHLRSFLPNPGLNLSEILVSSAGIEGAKKALADDGKRLDVYQLESAFLENAKKTNFKPDSPDGAFINFVKKKVEINR